MPQLLTTVIMKTDLRGSTPLFTTLSKTTLSQFLSEKTKLMVNIVEQHSGTIIKGEGDSFWMTFLSVTAAVEAAIALQQELHVHQVGKLGDDRVAVRIVIAAGDVLHQAGDIFGFPVNLTARIETVTPADEIYLSEAAWLTLNKAEIKTELVDTFELPGVARPVRVYRVSQPYRTKVLREQVIVSSDLRHFAKFCRTHSYLEVERLLVHIEQIMTTLCQEHGGQIRFAIGDTFFATFADVSGSLAMLDGLQSEWQAFRQLYDVPCPLSISVHSGDLAIFRSFVYGDGVVTLVGLERLHKSLYPQTDENHVLVSDAFADRLRKAAGKARLRRREVSAPHSKRTFVYELVPAASR